MIVGQVVGPAPVGGLPMVCIVALGGRSGGITSSPVVIGSCCTNDVIIGCLGSTIEIELGGICFHQFFTTVFEGEGAIHIIWYSI